MAPQNKQLVPTIRRLVPNRLNLSGKLYTIYNGSVKRMKTNKHIIRDGRLGKGKNKERRNVGKGDSV